MSSNMVSAGRSDAPATSAVDECEAKQPPQKLVPKDSPAPSGWRRCQLQDVAVVQTGLALGKTTSESTVELPYIRVANVQDGYVDLSRVKCVAVSAADAERYRLQPDDVLFTEGGDFDKLGRGTVWRGQIPHCLHQNHVFAVRCYREHVLPEYLAAAAASSAGRRYFRLSSKQSTNLASINSTQLKEFPLFLPPIEKQGRITAVLQTWDEAIDATDRLVALKIKRRDALRATIFGDVRSGGVKATLREVTTRVDRPSDGQPHPLMTIASQSGFVLQSEKYARDMAGNSASSYTLLRQGEFAYNKGNSLSFPQGCIFRLEYEAALVPFVYFCFELQDGLHSEYFRQLFAAGYLNPQLARLIKTGVRNNGLLNIGADEFFSVGVPIPPEEQQEADALKLRTADQEIEITQQLRNALQRQRRGLMQKLLSGEWRTASILEEATNV